MPAERSRFDKEPPRIPGMPGSGMGGRPALGGGGMNRFAPHAKPRNTRNTLRRLLRFYFTQKSQLFAVLLLVLAGSVTGLAAPYLLGRAVDAFDLVTNRVDFTVLYALLPIMLIVDLVDCGVSILQQWLMAGASQRIVRSLRAALFDRLQSLPLSFFDTRSHGDLMSRLTNDIDNVSSTIASATTTTASSLFTILGAVIMMLLLSPRLTLAALITLPLMLLLTRTISRHTRGYFSKQQRSLGTLNGIIEESVSGLRLVRAFNRQDRIIGDFESCNSELREASVKAQIWSGFMMPLMNVIGNLGFAAVAAYGGVLALSGSISVGVIASFLGYSRQFTRPLNNIAGMYNNLQSALAGAERVFELLDEPPETPDRPDAGELPDPRGHVEFSHVTFSYPGGEPVLRDVSFSVPPGSTIALVGATGAGKTTIVNLLTRFYDVTEGQVRIDGLDVRDVARESLRRCFSVVLQDTCLFTGTLLENIRYGRPEATREEAVAAAQSAGAHPFISRLPQGYDTQISGETDALSQGQRQLLAISRALLCGAPILLLDEATSSVDTRTERRIREALGRLMEGRTSFLIAHRLSTIRDADRILVLDGGRIVESGNHGELLELNGIYARLYRSQTQNDA